MTVFWFSWHSAVFTRQHNFKNNLFLRGSLLFCAIVEKVWALNADRRKLYFFIPLSAVRGHCPVVLKPHDWPNDLADKHTQLQFDLLDSLATKIFLTRLQRVRRDLGSPQLTSRAARVWGRIARGGGGEQIKGYQRNPVGARQLIVRPWCEAEALLLPADKVAPLRSAEPLHLCTRPLGKKKKRGTLVASIS